MPVPFEASKPKNTSAETKDPLDSFLDQAGPQWEEIELPSKGLYYGGNSWSEVAIPNGIISVRPWTINEEKIMNTTRYVKANKAIDMIFERTCKLPDGFKTEDLLIGDRMFLLYYFRGISYGNNYEYSLKCTNEECGVVSPYEFDLNTLHSYIKYGNPEIKEPHTIEMPDASAKVGGKISVQVRFSRQSDIRSLMLYKSQKDGADDLIAQELMQNIVSVNGNKDRIKIKKFIDIMSAKDASIIREFLRENSPGIKPTISVECDHCGNKMEMELPITDAFFRYTGSTSDRKHVE